ncbi:ATP synthase F0 subunit B [Dactylosporangium salmoneum]|uniref:Uncharacterized protein n=1 Tax=Dactylosporangium salmoneum TaxID=53361 RepID=A0ABN3GVS3_9ACTN
MTTYDDANPEPSEVREPALDELLGEVLGLIDEVVTARLADGELVRRRARIKANVDRGPLPPAACGSDTARTKYLTDLPGVPTTGSEWPQGLEVYLAVRRRLIAAAERDAEEIRRAARQAAEEYRDAALKRAAETVAAARQEAEQILATARQEAEQIVAAAEADREHREQMSATTRHLMAPHIAGALPDLPAQPGQQVELIDPWQASRRGEFHGLLPHLQLVAQALRRFEVVGMGGMGSVVAAGLGNGVWHDLGKVFPPGRTARHQGSWARSTALRVPKDPATGDACVEVPCNCSARTAVRDYWNHVQSPAEQPKGRSAAGRTCQLERPIPVALASLRDYLRAPADLESADLVDGWLDCRGDATPFSRLVVEAKRCRPSDADFDALPTTPRACTYVVLFVSHWSLNEPAMFRVDPHGLAASDDLPHGWRPGRSR